MAWSWSHTNEAYQNAEANLRELPIEELRMILAEWEGSPTRDSWNDPEFSLWHYRRALARIKREDLPTDVLADAIWDRASDFATCDNGGFNAWLCPFGCGPHCVSFDRDD